MQTAESDEFTFLTDFTQKMNFQQNSSYTYLYKTRQSRKGKLYRDLFAGS